MYLRLPILLVCLAIFSHQDETGEKTATNFDSGGGTDPTTEDYVPTTLAFRNLTEGPIGVGTPTEVAPAEQPPPQQLQGRPRPGHPRRPRRPRRPIGFYNDGRYRDPANNPNNPSSPYAFRGRPGQPPHQQPQQQHHYPHQHQQQQQQQYYDPRYYDPYGQATQDAYYAYTNYYYNYPPPNYPYPQHQQQPYPPQPYPPQPYQPPRHPPSPPPTQQVPELYYLQSPDTPDGQYHYKRVSVQPEVSRRRRPRGQHTSYNYPYSYNPYDPYFRQPYGQGYDPQYPHQQGYNYPPYQFQQPRGPRSPRRLRPGLPSKSTAEPRSWRLTSAPAPASETSDLAEPARSDLADVPPAPENTREDTNGQPVTAGAG